MTEEPSVSCRVKSSRAIVSKIVVYKRGGGALPYIGRSMSTNAKKAHDQGLMPISSFGRKQLDQCGFKYSVGFFRWLCKKNYIKSNGFHHTGAAPKMTKFYSSGTIGSFAGQANLPALYAMYRGKMSEDEVYECLGVRYYRIECAAGILGMKQIGTVVCDVIYYDGIFYLSIKRKFWEGNTSPRLYYILQEYKRNDPQWRNNHRKEIEKKILMFLSRPPKNPDEADCGVRRKMLTPDKLAEKVQPERVLTCIDDDGNEESIPGYMQGTALPKESHRADSLDEAAIEEERLKCLTERQREAWKLKQQGLTYNEIASKLSISYVGARNHVIHAEEKLQKYDSRIAMEKGSGESAGVLWTAKPQEQEIELLGNTNYPVEQPLTRADALFMLKLAGDFIKTCEYVTPHNNKKEWVPQMPYMYEYAVELEKKLQLAVYGAIQYPPDRDYEKQMSECMPVDVQGEDAGREEAG